jgi:NAD(P)-dependent dehydrogenase (short-subunit alcohol dehydrogenase family)
VRKAAERDTAGHASLRLPAREYGERTECNYVGRANASLGRGVPTYRSSQFPRRLAYDGEIWRPTCSHCPQSTIAVSSVREKGQGLEFMERRSKVVLAASIAAGVVAWRQLRRGSRLDLRGKVVLITGGSRGLGLQLAREFGSRGAVIAICARDRQELERAKADLTQRGVRAYSVVCDVTDRAQVEAMVHEVERSLGTVDVLVNNAGVIEVGPVSEMNVADFERAMGVMFWGALYPTLAVVPAMRARRSGSIVNITSIGAKVSVPHLVPYACAKFAALALSEGLASELSSSGIRVTTIVPGLMRTGSHLKAEVKGQHRKEYGLFATGAATPLVSIGAERAARSIVKATIRGDRQKILSVPATLLAHLNGAFPAFTGHLLSLVSRLLPSASVSGSGQVRTGADVEAEFNSAFWKTVTEPGRRAAEALNQL